MAHLVNLLYEKPRTQELVYTQHTILTDELVMGKNGVFVPYGKPYLCADDACYAASVLRRYYVGIASVGVQSRRSLHQTILANRLFRLIERHPCPVDQRVDLGFGNHQRR